MSECPHCGATDDPDNGIVVGIVDGPSGTYCTVCRTDELREKTVLSDREAQIAAHKQITGASHRTIGDRLGLERSTVAEYSRRMKDKVEKAAATKDELSEFL